jgi:hypothetical protein
MAPSMVLFYVQTNQDGALYINNLYSDFNMKYSENQVNNDVYTALRKYTTQSDYLELYNEVETAFSALIKENKDIYQLTKRIIPSVRQDWEDSVFYAPSSEDTEGKKDAAIKVRGTLLTDVKTELDTDLIAGENAPAGIRLTITDDRNPIGYETSTAFIPRIHYGQKTVKENDKDVVKNTATATVKAGAIAGNETNPVYDFDLNVYTKSEIDDILDSHTRAADALRYKGTIDAYDDLAKKTFVSIGDTYKLAI